MILLRSISLTHHVFVTLVNGKKSPAALFVPFPSLDGTLRVDLRSTKRAPARLSDISFVAGRERRDFRGLPG
jgi:hypothetical protein